MAGFSTYPLKVIIHVLHVLQIASAVVVLGITGWAVRGTKTLTVIYSLIIVGPGVPSLRMLIVPRRP